MLGALASSAAGCSLSLSGPDPQASVRDTPRCDTGKGTVALDGVMGTLFAVPALAAFGGDATEVGVGVVLGLASVAYIAAAVRGSGVVDECRAAVAAHDLAVNQPARDRSPSEDEDDVRRRRGEALARRRERARPSAVEPPAVVEPSPVVEPPPAIEPPPVDPTAAPAPSAPAQASAPAPAPAPVKAPAPAPAEAGSAEPWREFWKEIR